MKWKREKNSIGVWVGVSHRRRLTGDMAAQMYCTRLCECGACVEEPTRYHVYVYR